jgi:hypothetical protein
MSKLPQNLPPYCVLKDGDILLPRLLSGHVELRTAAGKVSKST